MSGDPYAAWVHLPPADLSDVDPRFERARWEEDLYYEDFRRTTVPSIPDEEAVGRFGSGKARAVSGLESGSPRRAEANGSVMRVLGPRPAELYEDMGCR